MYDQCGLCSNVDAYLNGETNPVATQGEEDVVSCAKKVESLSSCPSSCSFRMLVTAQPFFHLNDDMATTLKTAK